MKRIPIVPTLIVLLAVAYMVHLGLWQLDRLGQKEAMLARYEAASKSARVTDFKNDLLIDGPDYYSRVRVECTSQSSDSLIAGRNAKGQSGWAHQFDCHFPYSGKSETDATVVIGWSEAPVPVQWKGGTVSGTVVPPRPTDANAGCPKCYRQRLVADPPLAGLQANAKPDPRDIPNNHLAYAVQWFLFAGVALVIYALALRKRLRGG